MLKSLVYFSTTIKIGFSVDSSVTMRHAYSMVNVSFKGLADLTWTPTMDMIHGRTRLQVAFIYSRLLSVCIYML